MVSNANVWVKFFQAAGVPSASAASYAHIFYENRIEQDMLMDLNKEYLREMGITPMGDIIAILRHAKKVCEQNAREKVLAGEKQSIATMPVSPLVLTKTTKLDTRPKEVEQIGKPARRVLPEHEGKYKITLPSGTTQRSKQILAKKASLESNGEKKGIFARLEKEPKIQISGVDKPISSSIFSRLGGKSNIDDILEDPSSAFAGILKKSDQKLGGIKKVVKQQKVIMVRKIPAKAATMVADEYQQRMETGEKSVSFSNEDEILEIESRESLIRKHCEKNKLRTIHTRLGINGRQQNQKLPPMQNKVLPNKTRKIIKLKPNTTGSPNKITALKSDLKFNNSVKNRLTLKKSLKNPDINNLVNEVNHVSISARLGSNTGKKTLASSSSSSSSVFDRLGYNKRK